MALSSRGQFIAQAFAQIACFAKLRHPEAPTVRATATKFQAMSASHLPARCCQIKRLVVSQFRRDYNGAAVYISRALSLLGPRGIKLSHMVDAGIAQSFLSHIIKDADCVCFGCPLWSSVVAV